MLADGDFAEQIRTTERARIVAPTLEDYYLYVFGDTVQKNKGDSSVTFVLTKWVERSTEESLRVSSQKTKGPKFGPLFWRRRRDSNSRTIFGSYAISSRARSTNYATSPYQSLLLDNIIIIP